MRLGNVRHLAEELERERVHAPLRTRRNGSTFGGCAFTRGQLYHILKNPIYAGDIPHKDKVYPGNHQAIIARDEWDAVQARLAEHVRGVRKIRMASKALLAGKLFDHEGEPLIPVHTSKPASGEASPSRKRYRYYVTRQAHHDAGTALPALRIPAQEIEDAVRKELAKLLTDPLDIADRAQVDVLPDSFAAFASRCNALHHTILGGKKRAVRKLLKRVEVHSDRLILMLDISTLAELTELSAAPQTPATLTYAVKLSLTRTGHVLKLIDESGAPYAAQPDPALTGLLAQAHQWWGELAQGDIDIANLSRREGVTASWITRVVRLALLAPQVTVAILHGKQRATIDATTILKPNAISPEWEAQREVFLGF